jgi:antirestriction protein
MNEMRIYVASLSDYNNGRLEGKWFDLSDYSDASELMEAIQEMLDDLTKKYKDGEVREEWAVHDYEGIPSTLASEYMSEQDFQQLYDIAEVADDRGIPVEVLVERAGDTGSDDYQALADSLMFVVNGNDESDIVYEYEEQLGGLGNDFWSNHIYIDDVTERVLYGEDVDRFRDDILSENPDMDEDEAERQAEEMADEEAERREDLTTYLEDMGYGDEIPNWVSKDYEGAWKRSLSYDFDVIHHDGEMYVFSNNYSVGGTILSGMIGAYIGYQVGKQGLNKVAYKTGEKLGKATRRVKSSVKREKKRFDTGGGVDGKKYYMVFNLSEFKEKPMYNHIATSKQEVLDILLESYESIVGHKMYGNVYTIKDMDESDYNKWGVYINDDYAYVTANPRNFDTSNTISWQQQGRKMETGGFVVYSENEEGYYRKLSQHDTMRGAKTKMDNLWKSGKYGKLGSIPASEWENNYAQYQYAKGGKTPISFKGYTINFIRGEYRADAYGNPQFSDKNLAKLKQKINSYLRGDKYAKGGGVDGSNHLENAQQMLNHAFSSGFTQKKWDAIKNEIRLSNDDELIKMSNQISLGMHSRNEDFSNLYYTIKSKTKNEYAQGGGISGLNDLIRG